MTLLFVLNQSLSPPRPHPPKNGYAEGKTDWGQGLTFQFSSNKDALHFMIGLELIYFKKAASLVLWDDVETDLGTGYLIK